MPNFYPYLISSLPMLHFGTKPPFSSQRFLEICAGLVVSADLQVLIRLPRTEEAHLIEIKQETIKNWIAFDIALRNELVKIRAGRRHAEAAKYLRQDGFVEPAISRIAQAASRNPAILEAEQILDQGRWNALDELGFGHYFNLDFLILYAYKLRILERWERIQRADEGTLLEKALTQN